MLTFKKLGATEFQRLGPALHRGQESGCHPRPQPRKGPEHQGEDQGRDRRETQRLEHGLKVPGLAGFGNDLFKAARGMGGHRLRAFLQQRVGVTRRDRECEPVIDHDQLPLGVVFHRHHQFAALAQGIVDRHAGPHDARLGRHAQKLGPENHHRPVEHDQRLPVVRSVTR